MLKTVRNWPPVRWANTHPRLAAWIVLSAGMIVLLVIEAQNVGLLPGQWIALIAAVILVAGVCVWIISWEDEDDAPDAVSAANTPEPVIAASAERAPDTETTATP
jgi:hypothetical protein